MFRFADELGPAKIIHVHKPSIGLRAVLLVDKVAAGPSLGGVRMAPEPEWLQECQTASGVMNQKPIYEPTLTKGYLHWRSSILTQTPALTLSMAAVLAPRQLWRVPRFDLLQVHNLVAWQKQLPLLQAMKAAGQLRYVGITTSEGRRHREFEQIMRSQRIDFVQFSYNLLDREAEERLLPLARERGIAVLVNRPFRQGALLRQLQRHPLPAWASEIDCVNWAQFALKFIVSHPAVTCAIPATSDVAHVRENMGAAFGRMPDEVLRRRMAAHVERL